MTKAILLAAGRGRRLGIDGPKVLVSVAGRSLLERHLDNMATAGIRSVIVVTGHAHQQLDLALRAIKDARAAIGKPIAIEVETVFNELFEHGSIVSLQRAVDRIQEDGGIWMDADVLYPPALLASLVRSGKPCCVLLDGRSSEQGEEMMLAVQDERVRSIARQVGDDWDLVGESVGFFKVDAEGAAAMKRILDAEIAAARLDQEHEGALNKALAEVEFGYERVDAFPWTEIDFPEDIQKAEALVREVDRPS